MRILVAIVAVLCFSVSFSISFAQLKDGVHYFIDDQNNSYYMKITVEEDGFEITSVELLELGKKAIRGAGIWRVVNRNAMEDEEEYEGPDGWYEVELSNGCFLDFELPLREKLLGSEFEFTVHGCDEVTSEFILPMTMTDKTNAEEFRTTLE